MELYAMFCVNISFVSSYARLGTCRCEMGKIWSPERTICRERIGRLIHSADFGGIACRKCDRRLFAAAGCGPNR